MRVEQEVSSKIMKRGYFCQSVHIKDVAKVKDRRYSTYARTGQDQWFNESPTAEWIGEGQSHFFCQWVVCLQCMFGDWLPSMVEFGRGLLTSFDQLKRSCEGTLGACATVASSNAELLDIKYMPSRGHGGTTRHIRLERVPCSPWLQKERWKKAVGFGWFPTTWLFDMTASQSCISDFAVFR